LLQKRCFIVNHLEGIRNTGAIAVCQLLPNLLDVAINLLIAIESKLPANQLLINLLAQLNFLLSEMLDS